MTYDFENKRDYVQPNVEVCLVLEQQIIATSGQGQTETLVEDDYVW